MKDSSKPLPLSMPAGTPAQHSTDSNPAIAVAPNQVDELLRLINELLELTGGLSAPPPKHNSKLLRVARSMPPLSHWPNKPEAFHILKSEVSEWLANQPDIRQWLFQTVHSRRLIIFDPQTRTWCGCDGAAQSCQAPTGAKSGASMTVRVLPAGRTNQGSDQR